jgi:hypothetical protein
VILADPAGRHLNMTQISMTTDGTPRGTTLTDADGEQLHQIREVRQQGRWVYLTKRYAWAETEGIPEDFVMSVMPKPAA